MTDLVYQAEQVQQLLRCAICLDRFRHPKLLPCQHTFCESPCLEGLIDHYTRRVRCPECRLEHRVPLNGTAGFPNNLTIISFLDLPHQSASSNTSLSAQGGHSSQGVTEISHPEVHPHDNAALAQLEYHTPNGEAMCSDCGRIAILALCIHCNEQICEVCRHSHISSLKLEISRQLQRIRRALPNMSETLSSVEHRRDQLRRMCDSVKCVISDTIERYIRDLKVRQDHLYSEIDEFLFSEIRCLQEYQENLELELTSIASFCDNTEPLLAQRPDIESSNIDLQDIKRQGQQHIVTLQNQVSLELPTARQLTFQDESSRLSPAIAHFGELMVMIQNNSSSFLRNSVLGYSDSAHRTHLRDYNSNRETTRSSTASSIPRSHSSGADSSSSYRRTDSNHSTRGSGSSTSATPTHPRRTEAPVSTPSSTSSGVRFAPSSSSLVTSSPPLSRYSATNTSAGILATSRRERELGGLPSSYLDRDNTDEASRHTAGPGAASLPSPSSENSAFARRDEPTGASSGTRNEYLASAKPKDKGVLFSNEKRSSPPRSRRQQREMVPYSEISRPSTSAGVPSAAGASNDNSHVYRPVSPTFFERRSLPNSPSTMRRDTELLPDNEIFPSALTWHPRSENLPRFGGHSRGYGHYYTHNMTLPSSSNWTDSFGLQDRYSSARFSATNNSTQTPRRRPEALTYLHPGETDESSTSTENDLANERRHPLTLSRTDGEIYSSSDEEDFVDVSAAPGYRHCKSASTIVSQARNNYQAKHRSWTRFGEQGSGESQFMSPRGIAASPEGEIYVCDSSNHRIQVFDNTGIFIQSFGCYGQGNGEFDCISGVAVNSFGHIAITDRYNNRVQLFDRHGRFQIAFGTTGTNDGEMNYPWGITWDNMGFVYMCDKENNRVQVFQANGNFVRKFGRLGHGQQGTFNGPHYLAVSPDNLIYVTDSNNHRVQVFSIYGDYLFGFGSEGVGRGQLCNPRGIAIDDQGFVIIADCGNHRIQIFRGDGRFYSMFGTWGDQQNQFKSPEGVAVMTNGAVAVTDRENNRVQLF